MRIKIAMLLALATGAMSTVAIAEYELKREKIGEGPDFWPGRDKVIPHVSGDKNFSDTYKNWKDKQALEISKKKNLMSHEMNYRDFRWAEKSWEGDSIAQKGKELFHRPNREGVSCASCHGDNGRDIKDAYSRFPALNSRIDRIVTMPTQISECASQRLGKKWPEDTKNNSLLTLYMSTLADGEIVNVDVSTGKMKESYERGKDLFFKRTGHFNFACASCHTPPTANTLLRGQRPTTVFGDAASYPVYHFPYQLKGDDLEYLFTVQHQIRSCQTLSRMYPGEEGSPSMTDIEVFLRAVSNGYAISSPVNFYNLDSDYLE